MMFFNDNLYYSNISSLIGQSFGEKVKIFFNLLIKSVVLKWTIDSE